MVHHADDSSPAEPVHEAACGYDLRVFTGVQELFRRDYFPGRFPEGLFGIGQGESALLVDYSHFLELVLGSPNTQFRLRYGGPFLRFPNIRGIHARVDVILSCDATLLVLKRMGIQLSTLTTAPSVFHALDIRIVVTGRCLSNVLHGPLPEQQRQDVFGKVADAFGAEEKLCQFLAADGD